MHKLVGLLTLHPLPLKPDLALLLLRLWLGLTMLFNHGLDKLSHYSEKASSFADPLGVSSPVSMMLAIFAEVLCSTLLLAGLATRLAALNLAFTMCVAFFVVHKAQLRTGPGSGELAFIYLAGYLVLLLAGPGRHSLDARLDHLDAVDADAPDDSDDA